MTKVRSIQKVKVKGQGYGGQNKILSQFRHFRTEMHTECYTKLEVTWKRCLIVFRGYRCDI